MFVEHVHLNCASADQKTAWLATNFWEQISNEISKVTLQGIGDASLGL